MSATNDLRPDEQAAAEVLREQIGGVIEPKDVGNVQATHEFDLIQADGRVVAVEVTTATDEPTERLRGERRRHFPALELEADWAVWLPQDPELNLRRLMPELPPLIAVLERHGIKQVGRFVQPPELSRGGRSCTAYQSSEGPPCPTPRLAREWRGARAVHIDNDRCRLRLRLAE
jgi:hypothetical protein